MSAFPNPKPYALAIVNYGLDLLADQKPGAIALTTGAVAQLEAKRLAFLTFTDFWFPTLLREGVTLIIAQLPPPTGDPLTAWAEKKIEDKIREGLPPWSEGVIAKMPVFFDARWTDVTGLLHEYAPLATGTLWDCSVAALRAKAQKILGG